MDICLSLINSRSITTIEKSSSYPRKDDCVRASIVDEYGNAWEASHLPKTVLELTTRIQQIKHKLNPLELQELIIAINNHTEYMYEVSSNESAMMNAGEDM